MSVLDNDRLLKAGKKAEEKKIADDTMRIAAPLIEKEAVRKFAPIIREEGRADLMAQLEVAMRNNAPVGLAGYRFNQIT